MFDTLKEFFESNDRDFETYRALAHYFFIVSETHFDRFYPNNVPHYPKKEELDEIEREVEMFLQTLLDP